MNKISIIIPVLNEEKSVEKVLHHLQETLSKTVAFEIIFIDGGSSDQTISLLNNFDVRIISSEKGRAIQMNAGSKVATGTILYFLHCDSFPPKNFDVFITKAIENGNRAGCFRMTFDSNHIALQLSAWFTRFNILACRGGDQSLFVCKALFQKLNGFDESYTIYEDNEIIKRLYQEKQFVVLPKNIITSARKYKKNGVWRLHYHFAMIHLKRRLGQNPEQLKAYYNQNIH